ncbi:hypothetical protein EGM70_21480 [Enterobacteriaceae bacterium 89]|nr:hypothetical protein [Enterobacteriaceae bacterium 89]
MNLVNETERLLDALFNGDMAIAVFVAKGKHYYVFDDKVNFCIDVSSEYKKYIQKGWMKESQYEEAVTTFRKGIPVLTEHNFDEYLVKNNVTVFSTDMMRNFFTFGKTKDELFDFYNYIEEFHSISLGTVSSKWDELRMRLPMFYINFAKKIYRHTDWEINHEELAPADWAAQANDDFGLLVPDREQYWLIDGMNFWKLKL